MIASLAAAISAARHLREVLFLQQLAIGHGKARVDLDARGFSRSRSRQPGEQRLLDALRAGLRAAPARGGACGISDAISLSR